MKQLGCKILFLILFVGFVSCKSSFVTTIETQKPPGVILPSPIDGVVVVNNAIPQPSEYGIFLTVNKKEEDRGQKLEMDTTLWYSVATVAEDIQDAKYFEKVLIYNSALRHDNDWLSLNPITEEKRDSIYKETQSNVIISIDRLFFNMKQAVSKSMEGYFLDPAYVFLNVKTEVTMTCSVYISGREKRLTTFSVQDSIFFNTTILNDTVAIYKEIPNRLAREAGLVIGEKLASYFVPGWETADRFIYSSYDSRLREANGYFKNHKWRQARTIWEQRYEENDKAKDKARMAMNIAVSYEMEDNLDSSLEWAQLSKKYYDQLDAEKMESEKQQIDEYIRALNKRIQYNRILDIQIY